jgi:hypothetical protein
MAPLDPRWLGTVGRGAVIEDDEFCAGCGYNLLGLRRTGRCPECGRAIFDQHGFHQAEPIRTGPVLRDCGTLLEAPEPYVRAVAGGCVALMIGAAGIAAALGLMPTPFRPAGPLIGAASGLVWAYGVMASTLPRALPKKVDIDAQREWDGLRFAARLSQPCWFFGMLALGVALIGGRWLPWDAVRPALSLAVAVLLVAAAGLIPLCVILSNIAFWAANSALGNQLRACGVGLTVSIPLAAGLGFAARTPGMAYAVGMSPRALGTLLWILAGVAALPVAGLLWCILDVGSMGRWMHRSLAIARERVARFAAQNPPPPAVSPLAGARAVPNVKPGRPGPRPATPR